MILKRARQADEDGPSRNDQEKNSLIGQPAAAAKLGASHAGTGWLAGMLLVAATLIAYWPALHGEFFFDDAVWTTDIEPLLRDFSGLRDIWLKPMALQQYYPLTGSNFWIDHHLWDWWTLPYHLENVLLHAGSALLLWRLLLQLEVPGAWLAGAIFALHPLTVESTAWVTERKNVLSMFFFLAAILSYGRFAGYWKDSHAAPRRGSFALAWFLFVGALLSKITAFALPAVILLLCWWKRGRIRWKEDVLPILPFFAVSVGLGLWITWLEKHHVGAQGADWNLNWMERILVAGRVPWFYAGKLLWPFHLCFVYPKWPLDTGAMWQWLFPVAAVAALVIPWLLRNRIGRGMAAAAFYFFGTLFPVLGFLNFYWTLFSYVGDHLVYLSSLGVLVPVAAMVATMANRWRKPALQYGFAILFLPLLAALTWREAGQYRNAATMWRSTISKNPACWLAYNNLASDFLQTKGHADEAQVLCEKSVSMKPDFPEAHYNLGVVHHQMGRTEEEIAEYETALKFSPAFANAHLNLGEALARKGRSDDAMSHYQKVMALKPSEPEAHYNMGNLLIEKGEVDQAIAAYQQALIIKPDYVLAHNNLGNSLLRKKEVGEAIAHFETAAQIDPGYVMAHQNLGSIYLKLGRYREAIDHCEKAVKIDPSDLGTLSNLAWLLATAPEPSLRDGPRAIELARHASELSGGNHPTVLHTLAAAYAEDNRFDEAAQTAERALSLATAQGNNTLAEVIRNERTLYLAGQPVRAK